ncbi:hypothetical protein BASA81_001380 [Batrachochytrium salamandrivorans]|nr:hypothetical protein BASA81_001380 [Batrachochytrium salamandrivorans]
MQPLLALVWFAQLAAGVTYVNSGETWTVYLADYQVSSPSGQVAVQVSSELDNFVSVQILYKKQDFSPESLGSKFAETKDYFAHIHSDPCDANNGTHWKADRTIPTAVESNELWFKHSSADAPWFAKALTPGSHAVPPEYDANVRSLTIHEPKIGTTAAKLACIPLRMAGPTSAPTTRLSPSDKNLDPGPNFTTFIALVIFICLGGVVALYVF